MGSVAPLDRGWLVAPRRPGLGVTAAQRGVGGGASVLWEGPWRSPGTRAQLCPPLGAQALTLGFTQSLSAGPSSEGPAPAGCPAPTPSRGSRRSLLAPVVPPGAAPCALGCPREDARAPGLSVSGHTAADTPRSCPAAFSSRHRPAGLASAVFGMPSQEWRRPGSCLGGAGLG